MAHYNGKYEAPTFTYEDVYISLIPPRKRDYSSKSHTAENKEEEEGSES